MDSAARECRYCGDDAVGEDALGRPACKRHIEEVADDAPAALGRECEVCGNPEGTLCDDCEADERERDEIRREDLAEEDRFLYGI
jgi:hypothetical protein